MNSCTERTIYFKLSEHPNKRLPCVSPAGLMHCKTVEKGSVQAMKTAPQGGQASKNTVYCAVDRMRDSLHVKHMPATMQKCTNNQKYVVNNRRHWPGYNQSHTSKKTPSGVDCSRTPIPQRDIISMHNELRAVTKQMFGIHPINPNAIQHEARKDLYNHLARCHHDSSKHCEPRKSQLDHLQPCSHCAPAPGHSNHMQLAHRHWIHTSTTSASLVLKPSDGRGAAGLW